MVVCNSYIILFAQKKNEKSGVYYYLWFDKHNCTSVNMCSIRHDTIGKAVHKKPQDLVTRLGILIRSMCAP